MATATLLGHGAPSSTVSRLFRFTVPQYIKLAAENAFGYEARTELIDGLVVQKMARDAPHDGTLGYLTRRFGRWLPDDWIHRCQLGLLLARSVPEPDLAIVRGPETTYQRRHPRAADAALLVEVANSTLEYDRETKGPLYAEARIPEYWIVNVVEFQVEVYTQPRGGKEAHYRKRVDYSGRKYVPLILGGREIAKLSVSDLFAGLTASEGK